MFLDRPYGAYFNRDVPREDAELTHVGRGTPGGEYLRRFWQPVALSADVRDLPLAVRVLGEDLVLFRDRSGRAGLLERHCSHRGTSLEYGLVSERGIRCCYHGWLFDVDGRILETPGEPADSTLRQRLCHGAYPVQELQGLVFAYLGPPDRKPALPIYDTYALPGYRRTPAKWIWPANWIQIRENSMDPVHTAFLHTIVSGAQFTPEFGLLPELEWAETRLGMVYIATRRVGENVWVRIAEFILPNIHQVPSNWNDTATPRVGIRPMMTNWSVPIDDTTTLIIGWLHQDESSAVDIVSIMQDLPGQTADRPYEERQRRPGDYEAQVMQRPIAIHALEHLGASDRGVIMFRKLVRSGIRAVARGDDPPGVVRTPGPPVPTLAQDTIVRVPPAPTGAADVRLLRDTGRRVVAGEYAQPAAGRRG